MQKLFDFLKDLSLFPVIVALSLIFLLSVPVQRIVNGGADWVRDFGVFYNPEREGMIALASPQLFTRERLINQRLKESAWIDRRIEAVDDMIKESRFGRPSRTQEDNRSLNLGKSGGNSISTAASSTAADKVLIDPMDEFKAANEYRSYLVREKFQSILDDAHDTSSNTLQRLNFNLTISPARRHSTAIAAASVTLEEPTDPEWILQKYGELLNDVREELQRTAEDLIGDRQSLLRTEKRYKLNAQAETVLREQIEEMAEKTAKADQSSNAAADSQQSHEANYKDGQSHTQNWWQRVDEVKQILQEDVKQHVMRSFQVQLRTVGPDPSIGAQLHDMFFLSGPPQGSRSENKNAQDQQKTVDVNNPELSSDKDEVFNVSTQASHTSGQSDKGAGNRHSSGHENQGKQRSISPERLLSELISTCSQGPTSIWALLSPYLTENNSIEAVERSYSAIERNYEAFYKASATLQHSADASQSSSMRYYVDADAAAIKLALRKHLSKLNVTAPCPPSPEQLSYIAMLQVLGSLGLEHTGKQPDWAYLCVPANFELSKIDRGFQTEQTALLKQNFGSPAAFHERCRNYWQALREIGVVQLVKAELQNTPVDTAGRQRRLDHYFEVEAENCDTHSCQLTVRTKAEQQRMEHGDNPNEHGLTPLQVGRQEALRLYAELSCYASARSYTVYPREGLGSTKLSRARQSWTISTLFGQSDASAGGVSEETDISRDARVFGIGDTGARPLEPASEPLLARECSPSFIRILNALEVSKPLEKQLVKFLEDAANQAVIDEGWRFAVICRLRHFKGPEKGRAPRTEEMQACADDIQEAGVHPSDRDFTILHVTASVRHMRQRKTTISWLVYPDQGFFVSRHKPRDIPLSAIVSLPSWWPGIQIKAETCWLRPKRLRAEAGRSLCRTVDDEANFTLALFDRNTHEARARARVETLQTLPLPYSLEDVLPKLGFFLVRFPYVDRFDPSEISLESGREAKLRLTGKRLWKNPMVRIGEQWHTEVEVLPDMGGILATFDCLAPLPGGRQKKTIQDEIKPVNLVTIDPNTGTPLDTPTATGETTDEELRGLVFAEERPVQVWTSEGKTQHVAVTVNAFRPRHTINGQMETPCWSSDDLATAVNARK